MTKHIFIKSLIFCFITLSLISCDSGSSTSPKESNPYFPTSEGSYWIYEVYDVETEGEIDEESKEIDSVVSVSPKRVDGKDASVFARYTIDEIFAEKTGESYYFTDDVKIYFHVGEIGSRLDTNIFPVNDFFDEPWLPFIDIEDDLWRIYKKNLEDISIPGFAGVKIEGEIEVNGSSEGLEQIEFGGRSETAMVFLMETSFVGKLKFGNLVLPITFEQDSRYYLVENIGAAIIEVDPVPDAFSLPIPDAPSIDFPGSYEELIRFDIK